MKNDPQAVADALDALQAAGRRRIRRVVQGFSAADTAARPLVDGVPLLNFCSNDYLDLAREPAVAGAMADAARHWGSGSGAAHLVTGHSAEHHALEEELAAFTGREAALLFSTGYMANVGVISALAARGEIILQDKLNHASLLDGARLSDATLQRYRHADAADAGAPGRCRRRARESHRHRWRVQHGWRHRAAARTGAGRARAAGLAAGG